MFHKNVIEYVIIILLFIYKILKTTCVFCALPCSAPAQTLAEHVESKGDQSLTKGKGTQNRQAGLSWGSVQAETVRLQS